MSTNNAPYLTTSLQSPPMPVVSVCTQSFCILQGHHGVSRKLCVLSESKEVPLLPHIVGDARTPRFMVACVVHRWLTSPQSLTWCYVTHNL